MEEEDEKVSDAENKLTGLTLPSEDAVKNSAPVLLETHIVLKTGSVWAVVRLTSPTGLPPSLWSQ